MSEFERIEKMDEPLLTAIIGNELIGWFDTRVDGHGSQRKAYGSPRQCDRMEACPKWCGDSVWIVAEKMRERGFRVNIAEVAPGVGEVIIVEHSPKHPKQDRVEVTCYYGKAGGMDTCAVALCRAALMALATPMIVKE